MLTQRIPNVNSSIWIQLALILFVTTLVYLPIFQNGFVIDDHVFVGNYHPTIAEAFRGAVPPGHEGVYRPVRGVLYTAYNYLFGTNPFFYHLHSLIVHLMATVLVFLIVDQLSFPRKRESREEKTGSPIRLASLSFRRSGSGMTAFIAALFFGLHPIHTESITYIAASMEMTGVVFMLGAFWLYIKSVTCHVSRVMYASILFALLAYFTYEMTVTLPILLLLYEWTLGLAKPDLAPRERYGRPAVAKAMAGALGGWGKIREIARKTWGYWVGAGGYLFIRFVIMGIVGRSTYPGGSIWYALLTLPKVLIQYVWVNIWPVNLMNNHILSPGIEAFVYRGYRMAGIIGQSILDPEILLGIGVIGVIGVIGWQMRKTHPLVSFSIAWFFVSLLPVMGFVPGGSMFNERMLYIPSVGWVMAVAYAIGRWGEGKIGRWGVIWAIGVIALLYGVRTAVRNFDWHDDVTLWQKDVAMAPTENAYAYFALGNAYNNRKEFDRAVAAYQKSVAINPGFAVGYASLSRTYRDMGNIELSNINYQLAERAEPGFWGRP